MEARDFTNELGKDNECRRGGKRAETRGVNGSKRADSVRIRSRGITAEARRTQRGEGSGSGAIALQRHFASQAGQSSRVPRANSLCPCLSRDERHPQSEFEGGTRRSVAVVVGSSLWSLASATLRALRVSAVDHSSSPPSPLHDFALNGFAIPSSPTPTSSPHPWPILSKPRHIWVDAHLLSSRSREQTHLHAHYQPRGAPSSGGL